MTLQLPPEVDWLIWRPVHAGHATLVEVERDWSITDLLDAEAVELAHARMLDEQSRKR